MIVVERKQQTVYRGRSKDLLTRRAACQQFAWAKWNASRPNPRGVIEAFCECDASTGYRCDSCKSIDVPDAVTGRDLADWLLAGEERAHRIVDRYATRLYRTHDPRIATRLRDVWRAPGRRGRLRAKTAYLDAAWDAYRARHGCGEAVEEHGFHKYPHRCDSRCFGEDPRRTVERLARWLAWRDGVALRTGGGYDKRSGVARVNADPVTDTFYRKGRCENP